MEAASSVANESGGGQPIAHYDSDACSVWERMTIVRMSAVDPAGGSDQRVAFRIIIFHGAY